MAWHHLLVDIGLNPSLLEARGLGLSEPLNMAIQGVLRTMYQHQIKYRHELGGKRAIGTVEELSAKSSVKMRRCGVLVGERRSGLREHQKHATYKHNSDLGSHDEGYIKRSVDLGEGLLE